MKRLSPFLILFFFVFLLNTINFNLQAQTNPTPQNLPYSEDFDDTTSTFTLLPTEIVSWTVTDSPKGSLSDAALSIPNGNASVNTTTTTTTSTQSTGGCYLYSTTTNSNFYIQTSSDTLNGTNQLAVSVITTNLQDIKVSYDIELITAQAKTIGVVLQYRIGTAGSWSTINQSIYAHNSLTRSAGQVDNFIELQLPQDVNDTDVVQLRWATWTGTEVGNFSGIGIDNIVITGNEKTIIGPITTCSEEEITYTFNNMPVGSSIIVSINLPPGVTAINSANLLPDTNTVVVDTSDISNPTYSFTTPATSFTLNYYVKANCETFDANTTNTVVTISDTINGVLNNLVNDTIAINSPWIIFENTASTNLIFNNAFINTNYARTFAYKNTGNSFTGDLLFVDTIPNFNTAAIQFVSAVIDSVTSGTATIINTLINDSIVQLKIRLTNFSNNSQLFIKEEIKLINCPNGTNNHSFFNAIYGCADDTLCKEAQTLVATTTTNEDNNDKPLLGYTLLTKGYPNCWADNQERIIRINNNGLSDASEVQIRFVINSPSWPTNITESSLDSFEVYYFDGVTKTPITFILDTFSINFTDFIRATTTTPLAAGDSLFFRYFEVINCIDSTDYDNHFNTIIGMHYEGFPSVNLIHPCNSTNFTPINFFPLNQYTHRSWEHDSKLQQTFFNYNGTLNGGDQANFEITSSNLFVASVNGSNTAGFIFNIDSSEIQIELQLDSGLGLIQDSLYLWGNIGGIPTAIYPDTIEYFLGQNPLIGAGDRIIAHFSIPDSFYVQALPQPHQFGVKYKPTTHYTDFFSSFKVKFRLEAFCEYLLAAGPSAIVQKFFFVPDQLCNPDCKIPLAKIEDAINIHCPGCIFPGWNLSAFDIQRTNFGFADNNNNNFPDAFPLQPPDTNLVQLKNVMLRDTLKCTLIANTSDGDGALLFNNIGVDYIFAQLLLQNPRMGHLQFLGASGTFTDSTGVYNLTIPDYAGVAPDSNSFYLDLSIDSLKIYSGDTSLTQFWIGNDLTIHLNFAVKNNFEQPHFNIEAINSFLFMAGTPFTGVMTKPDAFNFDTDSLNAMSDSARSELAFWCTGYEGRYGAIGTDFNLNTPFVNHLASGTQNNFPCKNVLRYAAQTEVGSTVLPFLGNDQTAWNSFSYELRNLWMMDSININYPNGYVLDSVVIINTQLTSDGVGGNTVRTCNPFVATAFHIYDMNDAIINPTSATIYPARNLTPLTANSCLGPNNVNLKGWDEAKHYAFAFILKNSVCDTPLTFPTAGNYPITTYWSDFPTATNGDTVIVQPLGNGAFTKPDAALTTNINSFTQDAPNSDLMMNITVNTIQTTPSTDSITHSIAENTFLIIHSPSGNVVIDSIVAIPSNQRIFGINQLNNDSVYGLGNVGYVWGAANFNVFANYNCANIELSDSILIYTGWNCNGYPDSLQPLNTVCYLDSQWVKFNIIKPGLQASLSVPDTLNVCDTLHYDIKLTATGSGNVDSINVWLLDSTGAYTYIPGSGQLVYNGNTFITPTGLDTLSFALSDTTLLANFEQDTAHFIFDILPDCSFYTSTDKVKIMITATNYCGNQLDTIIIEQRPLFTNLPLQDSLKVELFNDTISGCGDSATVMAVITNLGSNPTGANNSLTITLPTGFAWSSGIPFTNVIGQTYTFNINGGIAAGGTQTILFNTADTVGNGIYNMMAAVWVAQEVICSNDTCIIAQPLAAFLDTAQIVVTPTAVAYTHPNGITISSDTTWTGVNFKINGPVYIEDNVTLTIQAGSVIEFGPQGIIRNDQFSTGGLRNISNTLVLVLNDGVLLTGLAGCSDNFWKGIDITGEVEIINSTIENALTGINLHDVFDLGNNSFLVSGRLDVTNAIFRNNQRAIVMNSSLNSGPGNQLQLSFSTFENTTAIPASFTNQVTYITVSANSQFFVRSNTFNNNAIFTGINRPIGINYFSPSMGFATYTIQNNTFTDLQKGIVARNSRAMDIKTNTFTNVDEGILMNSTSYDDISNNNFTIAGAINNETYGVRLIATTGVIVQNNFFTGTSGSPFGVESYGIIAENTGTVGSTVFDNTFEGTDIGIQTQGDNSALKIRCNTFAANGNPHNIASWTTLIIPGPIGAMNTLMQQGLNCQTTSGNNINENQAGNEWLDNCPSSTTTDILVDPAIVFGYKAHGLNSNLDPFTVPACSSPSWLALPLLVGLEVCVGVNKTFSSCNNPFAGLIKDPDIDFEGYEVEVKNLITTYKNEINALLSQIDGGNTRNLLTIISSLSTGDVKNELIAASPYLSDEVLIAYCNSNPPYGNLQQVLISNSPLSDKVWQLVSSMNLPKGIKNQVNNAQTGVSARTVLEQQINALLGEIQLLINDLQRRFIRRQEKPREKELLSEQNDIESQKKLMEIYLAEDSISTTQSLLNNFHQDSVAMSTIENQQFCAYTGLMITVQNQNKNIDSLNAAEIHTLQSIAQNPCKKASTAKNILHYLNIDSSYYPIAKVPTGNLRLSQNSEEQNEKSNPTSDIQIYPNPTSNYFNVIVENNNGDELTLEIYNLLGKLMLQQTVTNQKINTTYFTNGAYLLRIIGVQGKVIYHKKLIIQK